MWKEFAECAESKKIVCYGAGNNAKNILKKEAFQPFIKQIVCFVDKDKTKIGNNFIIDDMSIVIRDISYIEQVKDEIVLVTISDYSEVGDKLSERGIKWFSLLEMIMDLTFEPIKRRGYKKTAILLNTPNYLNLGDHAIAIAEIDMLKMCYENVFELDTGMCNDIGLSRLKEYILDDDVIYIQGGGNMGSLWRTCENNIRRIIKAFPQNDIFIFPQSIFYDMIPENEQYFNDSIPIYNGHKHLTICLRDKQSFEFVKKTYTCKSVLAPDMVLTMNYQRNGNSRKGIGVLLRNDKERVLTDDYIECINETVNALKKTVNLISHHTDTGIVDRKVRLDQMLEMYASCELIITDRLHGMLFSVITNTPCIVFDNSYGKISSLYHTWLYDYNGITITRQQTSSELKKMISKKINMSSEIFRSKEFKDILLKEINM
ncbi:MAG: polysaccharide pyruvyl transferase family protein [Lachnospiraceae bacterium]|nr:polysaccharide pyruvyl transferase family protein [Lachnospiraceae bacterium]